MKPQPQEAKGQTVVISWPHLKVTALTRLSMKGSSGPRKRPAAASIPPTPPLILRKSRLLTFCFIWWLPLQFGGEHSSPLYEGNYKFGESGYLSS
jgi:hypothetical protein